MGRPKMTPDEFWRKVDKINGPIPDQNNPDYKGLERCWMWIGATNKSGYGVTSVDWKQMFAHRLAWIYTNGSIPDGLCVCHHCDEPSCCRPDHFFLGTNKDNSDNMTDKKRQSYGEKHSVAVMPNRPRGDKHYCAKLTDEQVIEMRKLYSETKIPIRELASKFGIGYRSASKIVAGHTWAHLPVPEHVRNRAAKLSEDTVREIRRLRTTGTTVKEIAHQFTLSIFTVNDIVYRRTWKNLA